MAPSDRPAHPLPRRSAGRRGGSCAAAEAGKRLRAPAARRRASAGRPGSARRPVRSRPRPVPRSGRPRRLRGARAAGRGRGRHRRAGASQAGRPARRGRAGRSANSATPTFTTPRPVEDGISPAIRHRVPPAASVGDRLPAVRPRSARPAGRPGRCSARAGRRPRAASLPGRPGPADRPRSRRPRPRPRATGRVGARRARARSMAGAIAAGRVGVAAVAEHDVEQDHGRRRVLGGGDDVLVAEPEVDHRVRPADGVLVVAEIDRP